jgi:transglutaminase-like putative cysteine protease
MFGQYLGHTFFIDCDAAPIKEKAAELTACVEGEKEKGIRIFYFARDEIAYNVYSPRSTDAEFKASHVLARREGYCVQKAVLLVALARAAGIPARLRFAEIRSHLTPPALVEKRGSNIFPYHGLADLHIDGRWVKATPIYDIGYCIKTGVAPIEFDGEKDAMLPLHTLDGRLHTEYIRDRGFFEDLPIDDIRRTSTSWKYMRL